MTVYWYNGSILLLAIVINLLLGLIHKFNLITGVRSSPESQAGTGGLRTPAVGKGGLTAVALAPFHEHTEVWSLGQGQSQRIQI